MLAICLGNYHVGKNIKKIHGLPEIASGPPLGGGLTKIPGDHETLSIIRHVGLHVDFPSMKYSLGPLGLHLHV